MTKAATLSMILAACLTLASPAYAQDGGSGGDASVNVFQFAVSHPVPDTPLPAMPSLGDSVPGTVQLSSADGNSNFAYFYYAGLPVIVDMKTRSVVRIGQ